MEMAELMRQNKDIYVELAPQVQQVFGVQLKPYYDYLLGFDIIKFDDEVIRPPSGVASVDVVRRRWGEAGVALIYKLIGGKHGP